MKGASSPSRTEATEPRRWQCANKWSTRSAAPVKDGSRSAGGAAAAAVTLTVEGGWGTAVGGQRLIGDHGHGGYRAPARTRPITAAPEGVLCCAVLSRKKGPSGQRWEVARALAVDADGGEIRSSHAPFGALSLDPTHRIFGSTDFNWRWPYINLQLPFTDTKKGTVMLQRGQQRTRPDMQSPALPRDVSEGGDT